MPQLISGLFRSPRRAESAIQTLMDQGVPPWEISVLASRAAVGDRFVPHTQDRMAFGVTGGGDAASIRRGFVPIEEQQPPDELLATGPILSVLDRQHEAPAGRPLGGLSRLGFTESQIEAIEDSIDQGAVFVGVRDVHVRAEDAQTVFRAFGADSIASSMSTLGARQQRAWV